MSILESLVSQVLGQQPSTTAAPSGIAGVLMQMLGGQAATRPREGGVSGLLDKFRAAGLGHVADSWVGTGANQPISPQQLETVFGHNQVQDMSRQAGMQSGDFLSQLSHHLPRMVDGMTPDGRLPDEGTVSV